MSVAESLPENPAGSSALPESILPHPRRRRWQPLRGGLFNVFRYDYEEFRYEEGHLLLRGNNGTGKSRVLALQLPFLLDGEVAPHRLEPDGDPAKRIEWNLLMGRHGERLGYTWIEFGRLEEDGTEHYRTLGCGLHAVEGRGLVARWFFVTRQRIGKDLFLQSPGGHPLVRGRLEEEISEAGEVFTTAAAYRAAVNRELFGLDEARYDALVNLLIQLRQPQLARKLDEEKLSAALSEALPPVSADVLGDVADSFRSLEDERHTLEDLQGARKGTEAFLEEYRLYAGIAARRRAEGVRGRHSAYEAIQRQLRAAEMRAEEAEAELARLVERLGLLRREEESAAARVEALASSPEMRDARALEAARQLAAERQRDAERARREHAEAEAAGHQAAEQLERAEEAAREAQGQAEEQLRGAAEAAEAAGLAHDHESALRQEVAAEAPEEAPEEAPVAEARRRLEAAAERQRRNARHLRQLSRALAETEARLARAKEIQTELEAQLDEAQERQRQAHQAREAATTALAQAYRDWAAGLEELRPAEPEEIAEALAEWAREGLGPSPVAEAAAQAEAMAVRTLAAARASLEARRAEAEAEQERLEAEKQDLEAGRHTPPAAPATREPAVRRQLPGAPLWQLCDFHPDLPAAERAGLEAALEASGLLDAWLTPDGRLLGAGEHDEVILHQDLPLPPADAHLGLALRPDETGAAQPVPAETVAAVLRHLGLGELREGSCQHWLAFDGRWRLGPLQGAWSKEASQHIGQSAREADRRRRLEALAQALAEIRRHLEAIHQQEGDLDWRQRRARREAAACPDDGAIRQALADIAAATAAVESHRQRLAEAQRRVAERRSEHAAAAEARQQAAEDLGLEAWIERLDDLEDALSAYAAALAGLWPTLHGHRQARRQESAAAERRAQAEEFTARRAEQLAQAGRRAESAAAERDVLEQAVGAAAGDVLARLEAARLQLEDLRRSREDTGEERGRAEVASAVARRDIEGLTADLEAAAAGRQEAIEALERYLRARLLPIALPDFGVVETAPWSVSRAVDTARRLEERLAEVASDDSSWDRSQRSIHRHIQDLVDDLLPHGYDPVRDLEDGLFLVTVPFRGKSCTVAELQEALDGEIAAHQSLLNAKEREILENHLIGEVASHLHERLHEAAQWVAGTNRELAARPTSTGMALRFAWTPVEDGPPGLAEACRQLLRAGGMWSPADREALGAFLQRQIQSVREANDTGTWQEHLTLALDYRRWHRFSVERQQDGQWKRLTRRTHGTGSGGEKAIALTVPQFAAAAAHYSSLPRAPRLILLDEAFVGVDADMRSKCMGLLQAFDLDFVMTSEREWGCYATLPGVAIYQLATRPGIDAVGVTRWVWNGRLRERDDTPLPPAAPPEAPEENGAQRSLLD